MYSDYLKPTSRIEVHNNCRQCENGIRKDDEGKFLDCPYCGGKGETTHQVSMQDLLKYIKKDLAKEIRI